VGFSEAKKRVGSNQRASIRGKSQGPVQTPLLSKWYCKESVLRETKRETEINASAPEEKQQMCLQITPRPASSKKRQLRHHEESQCVND